MQSCDSNAISSLSDSASTLAKEPIETGDSPTSSYTSSTIRPERHEPSRCTVVPSAPLHPKLSVRVEEPAQEEHEAKKPGDKAPADKFQLRPNRTAFQDLPALARQDTKWNKSLPRTLEGRFNAREAHQARRAKESREKADELNNANVDLGSYLKAVTGEGATSSCEKAHKNSTTNSNKDDVAPREATADNTTENSGPPWQRVVSSPQPVPKAASAELVPKAASTEPVPEKTSKQPASPTSCMNQNSDTVDATLPSFQCGFPKPENERPLDRVGDWLAAVYDLDNRHWSKAYEESGNHLTGDSDNVLDLPMEDGRDAQVREYGILLLRNPDQEQRCRSQSRAARWEENAKARKPEPSWSQRTFGGA